MIKQIFIKFDNNKYKNSILVQTVKLFNENHEIVKKIL